MEKSIKKSKMTIDKLARITQGEFLVVHKDINGLRGDTQKLRGDMQDGFSTMRKEIVEEVRDVVREGNIKIIASNDKVASKLDDFLNDRAAHDVLHQRITDDLHHHDKRISKLEAKV